MATTRKFSVYLGSDFTNLQRIEIDRSGERSYVLQSDISTISRKVYHGSTLINTASVTVSTAVYDTLQTGTIWTRDTTGYNFKNAVAQSIINAVGTWYVSYTFVLTGGTQFLLWVEIDVTNPPTD